MRLPKQYDFSARAFLTALGVVVAPDVELDRLSIGGRGSSGYPKPTPNHLEIVLEPSEADTRVAVDTWGGIRLPEWIMAHHLLSNAVGGRTLRFPLELRIERTRLSLPVDGRRRTFAGLRCGGHAAVRATIDGAYVNVEGRADLLESLRLRRLGERELRELLRQSAERPA